MKPYENYKLWMIVSIVLGIVVLVSVLSSYLMLIYELSVLAMMVYVLLVVRKTKEGLDKVLVKGMAAVIEELKKIDKKLDDIERDVRNIGVKE